jgi:hypothetical protein
MFASGALGLSGGGNIAGLANISTRPDMVGDASSTGTGTGFLTYTAGSGFRLLGAYETLGTINNMFTTTANLAKSANETFTTNNVATVTLESGGGLTGFNTGSILTVSSIGILAKTGNTGFTGGQINPGASSMFVHTVGDLTVDSYVLGNGITKDGAGNLSFNRPQYFGGFLNNNDGTTTLNSGAANTILVAPTATAVTTLNLTANAGTLDLNGQNQAFLNIASINNPLPGTGTLITSAGAARLTSTGGGTFGGKPLGFDDVFVVFFEAVAAVADRRVAPVLPVCREFPVVQYLRLLPADLMLSLDVGRGPSELIRWQPAACPTSE